MRASWRDTLLLLRQFGWPLFFFALAIVAGGILFYVLSQRAGDPVETPVEGMYAVLTMTFLQPIEEFPNEWYLQIFYFLMPVVGIGILAQGLTDFGILFFNRRARRKEWEMAVASTFQQHIVLIGLGHLGFRVMSALHDMDQEMVVIELDPKADLVDQARRMGIPVIHDDAHREEALVGAGVAKAKTIVICTQNDVLNMQIAFRSRRMNPAIHVVVRIFDDQFAHEVAEQFGFRAFSATGMAAPTFAAVACGVDITRPITIEGEPFTLASLELLPGSRLIGYPVARIEAEFDVSVVLLRRDHASDYHPAPDRTLSANDALAVFGGPQQITRLTAANR